MIYEHIRNPKDPADWKEPDEWIPREIGEDKATTWLCRLWRKSGQTG